ncbi:formate dehydrogenase accessory sulfurtransferase FdhD [Mucilaginibacter paludis]|uniref:Sulfur carrier protein FdhD n=1 Tax=Mucilaginibacter paludis DSM 18603 TaxID=714943 RepID=H1YH41_9SPHI|nr:formate dehydrogenase accessory sulfurtransferase FdhD [Mucilaginibacter paludis]EHQ24543.1 Protein fdhD [Mucilaginibacter paludis DSM 18603]
MTVESSLRLPIIKVKAALSVGTSDALAIEEPLEIRLEHGPANQRQIQNISVTMRTPGNDAELALGFLFTEGIISSLTAVESINHCLITCAENKENIIQVCLTASSTPNLRNTERNFYTTSSCGVCGKGSINAIRTVSAFNHINNDDNSIDANTLYSLPDALRLNQAVFADTGGLHAAALFTNLGQLLLVREDVGRHNALDKLIGAAINQNWLPLKAHVLMLSGRASFELVQKAVMAGIKIIAAVGAPSTLAVQLAEEFNVTLIGFLRDERFNIYTAPQRVLLTRIILTTDERRN